MKYSLRFIRVGLILLFACSCLPAFALVQPRVYTWQKRLELALPEELRLRAEQCIQELDIAGTPEQITSQARSLGWRGNNAPLELYIGIRVLLNQDRVCTQAERELRQVKQAIGACERYLRRLDNQTPGEEPAEKVPVDGRYEVLPTPINLPHWQSRLKLPAFNEFTSAAQLAQYKEQITARQAQLEGERDLLQEKVKTLSQPSHELRRFVLDLCDSLNPQTCLPYEGKRPLVLEIPPPPREAKKLTESPQE